MPLYKTTTTKQPLLLNFWHACRPLGHIRSQCSPCCNRPSLPLADNHFEKSLSKSRFICLFPLRNSYLALNWEEKQVFVGGIALGCKLTCWHLFRVSLQMEGNSGKWDPTRTSLLVQWWRLCASAAEATGPIPGQGTKILSAMWSKIIFFLN